MPKPSPSEAFQLARKWFLGGRRIDMRQLAAELGIGRATLYRWFGSRESLLGEVIWSVNERALEETLAATPGSGRARIAEMLRRSLARIREFDALQRFVAEDGEYALRVLTSKHSIVQGRLIEWFTELLRSEVDVGADVDLADLAYVIVRVCESFVWSDMITGAPPETAKAVKIVDLLIAAAETGDQTPRQ